MRNKIVSVIIMLAIEIVGIFGIGLLVSAILNNAGIDRGILESAAAFGGTAGFVYTNIAVITKFMKRK